MQESQELSEEQLQAEVNKIYTPLSVAKEEIWRRWNDKALRKKVEDFLGFDLPASFKNEPRSAWFRFIVTPNFEFQLVRNLAEIIGLDLVFFEFLNDKFCTRNQDKLRLGKMIFSNKTGSGEKQNNGEIKVIDLPGNENMAFNKIKTLQGENFVGFHRRIFNMMYGKIDTFDVSMLKTNGEDAERVYEKVLACFICHGVLFENYIVKDSHYEKKFTRNVVLRAIQQLESVFGVKPLIVPLLPIREEDSSEWMYYPGELRDIVSACVSK